MALVMALGFVLVMLVLFELTAWWMGVDSTHQMKGNNCPESWNREI